MKKILIILLCAILALSACTPTVDLSAPPDTTAPAETLGTAAPTTPSTAPTESQPPAFDPQSYLDFSSHTNSSESEYQTILADLEQIKTGVPSYAVTELPASWSFIFEGFQEDEIWGYDFRSMDLSKADLTGVNWHNFSFNTDTVWPETLPEGFDPEATLEHCKNPGLGIRDLHNRGIDGTGVGIAIIDQPLLLEHEEYADRLMSYERIHCSGQDAQMHGPAVASLAVGKTVGTAPGAKLYYIAETHGHYQDDSFDFDVTIVAASILRILEINEQLPEGEKIRVISISLGYGRNDKGYQQMQDAVAQAEAQNIFVITTSYNRYSKLDLMGLERDYLADPEDPASYRPAAWLDINHLPQGCLWVPMGSRTYADCHQAQAYALAPQGGLSWAVPWLAGFYAMCCQVKPEITPDEFVQLAMDTGTVAEFTENGNTFSFGKIINPAAVIEALQG